MMGELKDKQILIVGCGITGMSCARFLKRKGAKVTISEKMQLDEIDPSILKELLDMGVEIEAGEHKISTFLKQDLILLSPGVPLDIPAIRASKEKGIPVMGELEFASLMLSAPIIAITGTNGKTTTSTLIADILKEAGYRVFLGGNIGTPLIESLYINPLDYVVCEVSSFQLDTISHFSPYISILLNITPDHLERYPDFISYIKSKMKIFKNLKEDGAAIINSDDKNIRCHMPSINTQILRYGIEQRDGLNCYTEDNILRVFIDQRHRMELSFEDFKLRGEHNLSNLMAAVLCAAYVGVKRNVIEKVISRFSGLPHRLQYVKTVNGIAFYNDSKATNLDSFLCAVKSFNEKLIVIMGGIFKGGDLDSLVEEVRDRIRAAILIGSSKELFIEALKGKIPFIVADDMRDAVSKAYSASQPGDVVLLSPACSSFDMFEDYRDRGNSFIKAVEELWEKRSE